MKHFRRFDQRVLSVLLLIAAIHIAAKQFQLNPVPQENDPGSGSGSSGPTKGFQGTGRNSESPPYHYKVRVANASPLFQESFEVPSSVPKAGGISSTSHPFSVVHPPDLAPTVRALKIFGAPLPAGSTSTHHPNRSHASRLDTLGSVPVGQRPVVSVVPGHGSGGGKIGGGGSALNFSQGGLSSGISSSGSLPAATPSVQFTNPITTTPILIQDGFGPGGNELGYDGLEYCVPTAGTMALGYLGVNGFNQISPSVPTAASQLNLERVISGLTGTDPLSGSYYTGSFPSLQAAIKIYLAAKGISTSNYTLTVTSSPTVSQLASLINTPGTVVIRLLSQSPGGNQDLLGCERHQHVELHSDRHLVAHREPVGVIDQYTRHGGDVGLWLL